MKELLKNYDPKNVEENIYKTWEDSGFFNPDNLEGEPFSIMMPPPNVTGVLHLGHAMENALMDIMIRYQRMQGKKTLLLPGTDHAAVATQAKVEKILMEKGIENPRKELGREKLLEEIRNFSENSKTTILKQIRKMGTSCDWSRLAYTFDKEREKAVNTVFGKMYNDGLIFRGYRVINWSVKGQSTVSDDELEYIERPGKIYTFRYNKDFPISIATTRPETKFGDTAVAVNPADSRYQKYIGESYTIENFGDSGITLSIKIISDESVDPNFGTGAVGVTPAHSMADFEMHEKQNTQGNSIEIIPVIGKDGKMNENAGSYQGLTTEEARGKIVDWLKKSDLLEKEEEITQNVSTSDRFGDIVEILPMTQWFVNVNKEIPGKGKTLKDLMREAAGSGLNENTDQKINITPKRFEKLYFNWIDNLKNWCISRQVWWGHRIPIWYKENEKPKFSETSPGEGWKQDPDTLDTWFSSGLWTFSTLGWPEETNDLKTFHPTNWMQMGYEILFFWMARMILMSTYNLDEIPFKDVYIHGMLRDEKGQKFSKSLGNSIDPLEMSDKYGTDALRLSLILGISPGQDSKFYEEKVESARNFANKIWNISRFILEKEKGAAEIEKSSLTVSDTWILQRMATLIDDSKENFEKYNFSLAGEQIQNFIWNDFADWYLEVSKFEKNEDKNLILRLILEDILKLLHPFMPFITEHVWSLFNKENLLMIEKWPESSEYTKLISSSPINEADFELVKNIITNIRNLRSENKIEPGKKITVILDTKDYPKHFNTDTKQLIRSQENLIKSLRTNIEELEIAETDKKPENSVHTTVAGINIHIPLSGIIDVEKEKEKKGKEKNNLEKYISDLEERLNNKSFIEKAPKNIINQEREKLDEAKLKLKEINDYLKNLK